MRAVLAVFGCIVGYLTAAGPSAAQLRYGPDTCKNGFVWREAYLSDHVCVLPEIREQARRDNSLAASNVQPGGGPFGPDTCKPGLVWREARQGDHICVTPDIRTRAADDNRYAYSRQLARLLEHRPTPKPVREDNASTGGGTTGGYSAGAGGVQACKDRFVCPLRMKMAVDDDTCVCGPQ